MKNKIRRINLFAGPGAGKSTSSAWLFSQMKMDGFSIEDCKEYVKNWTYLKIPPTGFDQVYILGKQLRREDLVLKNGVELIVTDSPIFLSACYAMKYKAPASKQILEIVFEFEKEYPSVNIYLERGDKPYKTEGRFQGKEEAIKMDKFVKNKLKKYYGNFETIKYKDLEGLKEIVYKKLRRK